MQKRKKLLDNLGGLPEGAVEVKNSEWLYMLEEETRNSLAIEGYFASEKELRAIISGKHTGAEILDYYHTAGSIYDLALQYLRENQMVFDVPLVRHIHSELFREGRDRGRGNFRMGKIIVKGAKVHPPEADVEQYVRCLVEIVRSLRDKTRAIPFLARFHVLFESIHPFADGNGRAGRIIMNYLAISLGLPPFVIKGLSPADRDEYYDALEKGGIGFHEGFPPPDADKLLSNLETGNFSGLEKMLCRSIINSLNRVIAAMAGRTEGLLTLADLAKEMEVQPVTLRKWIERDKMVAVMKNGKLYSNKRLV
ncbi:MAG: Fic family protein, partial [Thermovirgaceae bacterium]|nr:Fic family protein [Thermovirgaceae bacterium]